MQEKEKNEDEKKLFKRINLKQGYLPISVNFFQDETELVSPSSGKTNIRLF
jgi:hypothetical protein